ncbi:hypothetical protein B0T11DRAFT_142344 [Plectosphaerella cucumerina]|uniref:GPI anchored protein n=1 Tax=Plectosphaerella cucumerina TaxID=40658 RepID=A0A8K0T7E2_9PEZI|nr:hypothetical protein B0T11DRAFT_142344 [Plectosphaerella cucumerina]
MLRSTILRSVLLATWTSSWSAHAQSGLVTPNPANDCSGGIVSSGFSCLRQPGCCFGECCGGGCCPLGSMCVNIGQPNEGCCSFDSPNYCGGDVPTFAPPACRDGIKTDVYCNNNEDEWYCEYGAKCGSVYGVCIDFTGETWCTSEGSGPPLTSAAAAPSPSPSSAGGSSDGGGGVGSAVPSSSESDSGGVTAQGSSSPTTSTEPSASTAGSGQGDNGGSKAVPVGSGNTLVAMAVVVGLLLA